MKKIFYTLLIILILTGCAPAQTTPTPESPTLTTATASVPLTETPAPIPIPTTNLTDAQGNNISVTNILEMYKDKANYPDAFSLINSSVNLFANALGITPADVINGLKLELKT